MYSNYQVRLEVRSRCLIRDIVRPLSLYVHISEYENFSAFLNLSSCINSNLQKVCTQIAYNDLKEQSPSMPPLLDLQQPFIYLMPDIANKPPLFVTKQKFNEEPLFYINQCLKEFGTVCCKNQHFPKFAAIKILSETPV